MWFSKPDYIAPVSTPRPVANGNGYSIGITDDNMTMLNISDGCAIMSLTMNDIGVRRMIKLLEATLENEDDTPA